MSKRATLVNAKVRKSFILVAILVALALLSFLADSTTRARAEWILDQSGCPKPERELLRPDHGQPTVVFCIRRR